MDAAPTEAALEVLDRERRAVQRAYGLLRRSLFAFAGSLAVFLVLSPFAVPLLDGIEDGWSPTFIDGMVVFVWGMSMLGSWVAFFVVQAGFLGVGYRLALAPRRLRRRLARFELSTAASVLRPAGAGRTLLRWLGAALGLVVLLFVGLSLGGSLPLVMRSDSAEGAWRQLTPAALLAALGAALVAADFRRRRNDLRETLVRIDRLERSLRQSRLRKDEQHPEIAPADIEEGAISARDWNQIARMEQQQIGHETIQVVTERLREPTAASYGVVRTRQLVEAASALAPGLRLRIEEEAEALSRAPRPPEAEGDAVAGVWRVRVQDTPLELSYAIDEDAHRIRLLDARAVGDD